MRSRQYSEDVLAPPARKPAAPPRVAAESGLVVEDSAGDFCGAVVGCERDVVTLEDRHGKRRVFPLSGTFLLEGKRVTLVRPAPEQRGGAGPDRVRVRCCPVGQGPGGQGQPDLRRGQARRRDR